MNPQSQTNEKRANDAAASLGLATNLSQMLMPKEQQPMEASQTSKTAPQNDLKTEMDSFKKEIKSMIQEQIGGLAKDIKTVIDEDTKEDAKQG